MSDSILGSNEQWVDGTVNPIVDTFVWVTYGKSPSTGTQKLRVVDDSSSAGVFLSDAPSGTTLFIHRENIVHLEAAIAAAKFQLGL